LARDYLGGHGLARARLAGEEHAQALAERELAPEAPLAEDALAVERVLTDLAQVFEPGGRQHDVVPRVERLDLARERGELLARLRPRRGVQVFSRDRPLAVGAHQRALAGLGHGAADLSGGEGEAVGQPVEVQAGRGLGTRA